MKVIKSCKATNKEFLMLKEKLGICLYEENYYTEEIIQIQDNTEVLSIKEIKYQLKSWLKMQIINQLK